jgi:dipeptidyl aminopeptidase/acylaminoacyl peptidase
VIDAISEQGTSEDPYPDTWFTGEPWRNFDLAWKQSPLAYVSKATAPVLILQGEDDTLDPPGQAKEFYHALRMKGVPARLLLFPRETHSSLGHHFYGYPSKEPWHGVMLRKEMIDFIQTAFSRTKP